MTNTDKSNNPPVTGHGVAEHSGAAQAARMQKGFQRKRGAEIKSCSRAREKKRLKIVLLPLARRLALVGCEPIDVDGIRPFPRRILMANDVQHASKRSIPVVGPHSSNTTPLTLENKKTLPLQQCLAARLNLVKSVAFGAMVFAENRGLSLVCILSPIASALKCSQVQIKLDSPITNTNQNCASLYRSTS